MSERSCVLLLVDHPEPGRAKPGLAAATSPRTAADLSRAMVEDMLAMLRWSEAEVVVVYDPASPEAVYRAWLGQDRAYWPQKGKDLSARRANALRKALTIKGFARALVLDSDIPQLDDETVRQALRGLAWNTCVLAPSRDGYCLAGFDRESFLPDMFSHVPVGAPDMLRKSLNLLEIYRRTPTLLAPLPAVEGLDDLRRLLDDPPRHLNRSRTLALAREILAQ